MPASPLNLDLGFSDSFSTPQSLFAGTVFNFGNAGAIGDDFSGYTQESTATGGRKGGAQQAIDANPNARENVVQEFFSQDNSTLLIIGGIAAVVAIGALIYYNQQG